MRSRPKMKIMWGRVIVMLLTILFSPILMALSIVDSTCEILYKWWTKLCHWIIAKLDTKKRR